MYRNPEKRRQKFGFSVPKKKFLSIKCEKCANSVKMLIFARRLGKIAVLSKLLEKVAY